MILRCYSRRRSQVTKRLFRAVLLKPKIYQDMLQTDIEGKLNEREVVFSQSRIAVLTMRTSLQPTTPSCRHVPFPPYYPQTQLSVTLSTNATQLSAM